MLQKVILLTALAVAASAATVEVRQTGPAVAFAYIKGYTGSCTWNLYQGASATGTPHPDVAAAVDTSRSDTLYDGSIRIMRLGHDYGDKFLRVNTQYTLATDAGDTGCAGTSAVTFSTYFQPPPVIQRSFVPKWDANTYTKIAHPTFDWTIAGRRKLYVTDPGGVPFEFWDQAASADWATGYPYAKTGAYILPGSGWTNPNNALDGYNTQAVINDTTASIIYPLTGRSTWYADAGGDLVIENIGVEVRSNSTASSSSDRQLDFCISFHTVAGTCDGTGFSVTVPQGGTLGQVASTPLATGSQGALFLAWPNEFPRPGFEGWGNIQIRKDQFPISTEIDAVTAGVVTASSGYFPPTVIGNYVLINGSYKAVASQQTSTQITLVDTSFSAPAGTAVSLPFGIIVKRHTATSGTVTAGFRFVYGGGTANYTFGKNIACHPLSTTYSGIVGRWCQGGRQGNAGPVYFLADNPAVRLSGNASAFWPVTMLAAYGSALGFSDVRDRPNDPYPIMGLSTLGWDPTDANAMYGVERCNNGASKCIFRFKVNTVAPQYDALSGKINEVYSGHEDSMSAGGVTVTNLTPPSLGMDIATQIANNSEWAWTHQGIYVNYASFASSDFAGFSGSKAFFAVTHGQDNTPTLYAVVEMKTGRVIRVFSTAYEPTHTGGIPEIRFGNMHSGGAEAIPDSLVISPGFPGAGNYVGPGTIFGPPIAVQVQSVLRGGLYSSVTALPYPYDNTYDNTCPDCGDVPAWIRSHWGPSVTNEFATLEVSPELCSERWGADLSTEAGQLYGTTCSWNASFWKTPFTLMVGDRFTWSTTNTSAPYECRKGTTGDCEIFMVVKILSPGGGGAPMRIVVHRDDAWDSTCRSIPYGGVKSDECVLSTGQNEPPNGWWGRMAAGRQSSALNITAIIIFDSTGCPTNQTITCGTYQYGEEPTRIGYGHSAVGYGTTPGTYLSVGTKALKSATFAQLTGLDSYHGPVLTNPGWNFAGQSWDYINGYAAHDQNSAPTHERGWVMDFNHFNGAHGPGEVIGPARNITPVSNCTNVYKMNTLNSGFYKISPLLGWAGHNMLEDVSGPSVDICNAHDYSFVYVQRSSDSIGITSGTNGITPVAGDVFVKIPYINRQNDTDGCRMAINRWLNDPCVMFLKGSGHGGMRRGNFDTDDAQGKFSQFLGYGSTIPGWNLAFSAIHPSEIGNTALAYPGFATDGVRNTGLLYHLPPFQIDHRLKNTMFNTTIKVPAYAGATHARIRFGFDLNFYCSGRAEACVTDSVMNTDTNPFAYIGETLNPHSCSEGCTIPLPVDLGRAFYYQIEWLLSGSVVKTSVVKPIVVN